jgi:hypothetical protein
MAKCSRCGKSISFIRMKDSGKSMPVDSRIVWYQPAFGSIGDHIVLIDGTMAKGVIVDINRDKSVDPRTLRTGYRPHWATCTKPDAFRNKKRDPKTSVPRPSEKVEMQLKMEGVF